MLPEASESRDAAATADLPLIVHVSGDFPDPVESFKTPVIRDLVDLTAAAFEHHVISINRVAPGTIGLLRSMVAPANVAIESEPFEYGQAVRYRAPGKGIWHRTILKRLGRYIAALCENLPRKPDLLVGHKLTIEGIAVHEAARIMGVPYALSIQGNTDSRILATRPDLRRHLARVFHEAEIVFPFTPWALDKVESALGKRSGPTSLLPCPTELDQAIAPQPAGNGFISVFHLKNWRGKNLKGLVRAWEILGETASPPPLEIIGGGTREEVEACRAIAAHVPQISFAGPMGRAELAGRMNAASGLVMPSLRESFGLVFVEALFAGSPVIYSQGTSVDGYFDEASFALGVDSHSPHDIAGAVQRVLENESEIKSDLRKWQTSSSANRFTRSEIASTFEQGLRRATLAR